jgi:hypothetical protein
MVGSGLDANLTGRDLPAIEEQHMTPPGEYTSHDGLGLTDLIARKQVKPEELVTAALQAREGSLKFWFFRRRQAQPAYQSASGKKGKGRERLKAVGWREAVLDLDLSPSLWRATGRI